MPKEKNMQNLPFETAESGVRLRVRLTPNAKVNAIKDTQPDAQGRFCLKISVTAVPEDGKANEALIKLLSKELGLAKSSIRIVSGLTDRNKTLYLSGEPVSLEKRLIERLLANKTLEKE